MHSRGAGAIWNAALFLSQNVHECIMRRLIVDPRGVYGTIMTLEWILLGLIAWGVVNLVLASIREHAD